MNGKYAVICMGNQDGWGIGVKRVAELELLCSRMTRENAHEICNLLNKLPGNAPARLRD